MIFKHEGTWSFKQPLVSGDSLLSPDLLEVQQSLKTQRRVRIHDLQLSHILTRKHTTLNIQNQSRTAHLQNSLLDAKMSAGQFLTYLLNLLSGVQRERVLGQTDLLIGVAEFGLSRLVKEDLPGIIAGHRVDDHAVVTRRYHDHTDR